MRAYFFNNDYVAGIRTGIQAGHAIDQMWLQFVDRLMDGTLSESSRSGLDQLRDFSRNHKTFVILHAGDHAALSELDAFFAADANPYPWASFAEPGLNDAITSIVIVIPERLYDQDATTVGRGMVSGEPDASIDQLIETRAYSPWELEFLKRRVVCALAM